MIRRCLAALVAGGLLAGTAAGCGVPNHSEVVVDGVGRTSGVQEPGGGSELPPGPEGTNNNPEEFVNRFLQAPAGDWEGAGDRVRRFLSPELRGTWEPPPQITVIRLLDGEPDVKPLPNAEVVLNVRQVGVLTNRGTLEPPVAQTARYTFSVGRGDDQRGGLSVLDPPPGVLLLTDTALAKWYVQRPIYFWHLDGRNLVPDLRYLPAATAPEARPNLLLGWLLGGPASWLGSSVQSLPERTEQRDRAYQKNGRLVVNLSSAVDQQDLGGLVAQLRWSLRRDYAGDLVLQIDDQDRRVETSPDNYLASNATYELTRRGAELYTVVGGEVRQVRTSPDQPVPATVELLDPAVNRNVRYAAISTERAALVRTEGNRLRLWVGPDTSDRFQKTSLLATRMSRPVMVAGDPVGYVAADGRLYRFTQDGGSVTRVEHSMPGAVTALALAPDGRRLAVVADGRPYLVALGGGDGPTLGVPRAIPTVLTGISGVSWLSETGLVFTGGNRETAALERVTVDGAVQLEPVQDLSLAEQVSQLVAFPDSPVANVTGPGGRIMLEADGQAHQVFAETLAVLPPGEVSGAPLARDAVPTAPFFLS